jgi:hypothetical protein
MAEDRSLEQQLESLRAEVSKLNAHRFIALHNKPVKLLGFQFLRGLAFGLGSVFGATFLVSVVVYFLSTIDFLPIIGDWATQIADQITNRNP